MQNYPNPFNPSTTIGTACTPNPGDAGVFNILGQQVALLQNGDQDAGFHEVRFDGSGLASGCISTEYRREICADEETGARKIRTS